MQSAQGCGTRILWSCCLAFLLSGGVFQQWSASAGFADDAGKKESVGQKQNRDSSPAQTERSEAAPQIAQHRISLRIKLDSDGEPPKLSKYLLADAAEIVDPAQLDGVTREDDRVLKLRKNVRLWLHDETVIASGNQAVIQNQKNPDPTVGSLKITVSGNVRWTAGGLNASADELSVTLRPETQGAGNISGVAEFTLRGMARLDAETFKGTADEIAVTPYPAKDSLTESSMRVKLGGNATLSVNGKGTDKSRIKGGRRVQAERIEFIPSISFIRVDQARFDPNRVR